MPLIYEHALGGSGSPDNPVGVGLDAGSPRPSLIALDNPRRPAGFGPIACTWRRRTHWLGSLDPAALARPVVALPDLFDWQYFQTAPAEQRTGFLHGDEWIVLEGMDPEQPILQMRLPGVTAAGRVYGLETPDGAPLPIAFHADSLHIDTDRRQCSLTFRGHFPVPDEARFSGLVVLAGAELPKRPLAWPASLQAAATGIEAPVTIEPMFIEIEDDPDEEDPEFGMETLPFTTKEPEARKPSPSKRPGTVLLSWPEGTAPPASPLLARASRTDPPPVAPEVEVEQHLTMPLRWPAGGPPALPFQAADPAAGAAQDEFDVRTVEAAPRLVATSVLPFKVAPVAPVAQDAGEAGDERFGGTVEIRRTTSAAPAPMRSPFRLAEPGAPPVQTGRAPGDIPGAPWASAAAPVVPPYRGTEQTIAEQTIDDVVAPRDEDETTVEGLRIPRPVVAPESAAAPEPVKAPEVEPARAETASDPQAPPGLGWSWATTAEGTRAEIAPKGPPPPLPKLEVQRSIYGRFVPGKKP